MQGFLSTFRQCHQVSEQHTLMWYRSVRQCRSVGEPNERQTLMWCCSLICSCFCAKRAGRTWNSVYWNLNPIRRNIINFQTSKFLISLNKALRAVCHSNSAVCEMLTLKGNICCLYWWPIERHTFNKPFSWRGLCADKGGHAFVIPVRPVIEILSFTAFHSECHVWGLALARRQNVNFSWLPF